jgi:predicted N-acetyltransferase YhbS
MSYSAPEKLRGDHNLELFDCGIPSLNDWLERRTDANEKSGASRTYVVCDETRVVAYYCLATGAVTASEAPGNIRRNMPDPIPVMVLGRLAVDLAHQQQGLGQALLRDAILRTIQAADIAGIRALLVHAIDEQAGQFYAKFGFSPSPAGQKIWMLRLQDARTSFLGST